MNGVPFTGPEKMDRTDSRQRIVGWSLMLANLGNDYRFASKEYISISTSPFEETKNKAIRGYAQRGQYHIIMKVHDS